VGCVGINEKGKVELDRESMRDVDKGCGSWHYLEEPRNQDDSGSSSLFVVPDGHGGGLAFCRSEVVGDIGCLHHGLLCWRVCLTPAIVRGPDPPDEGEKDGPGCGEDMICSKKVGKVEGLLWILLATRL